MIRRQAKVYKAGILAGVLQELEDRSFRFEYLPDYQGLRCLSRYPGNSANGASIVSPRSSTVYFQKEYSFSRCSRFESWTDPIFLVSY